MTASWANEVLLDTFLCDSSTPHGAVIICPGGGYEWRSPREAEPVARRFVEIGLHAFVLRYDCQSPPLGDMPLQQLSRAVAVCRAHAVELNIEKIAVCGFSAGAHLAAALAILHHCRARFPVGTDLLAHRPDAMILAYPVITSGEYAHRDSMERLAGESRAKQQAYSLEKLVTQDTPPAFIWHTADDETVPCQNSLLLVNALISKAIPCEFHLYPHGVHGLSLATPEVNEAEKGRIADAHVAGWFDELTAWIKGIWTK